MYRRGHRRNSSDILALSLFLSLSLSLSAARLDDKSTVHRGIYLVPFFLSLSSPWAHSNFLISLAGMYRTHILPTVCSSSFDYIVEYIFPRVSRASEHLAVLPRTRSRTLFSGCLVSSSSSSLFSFPLPIRSRGVSLLCKNVYDSRFCSFLTYI